ncbi:MAG: cytochrome b/b6 domain-containing protein [Bryobacteraceae bacterium]
MQRPIEKHPLAIRWFHWISFPLLFLMIWSGLMIYWANDVYRIGMGDTTLVHFFPDWFYKFFALPQRLAHGMELHFFFMWFFAVNGVLYICYLLYSGEWRYVIPDRNSFREAILVTLHDLHLRTDCPPQSKYNGAQRIAYSGVVLMGAASLVTGLAIYKPTQLAWLTSLLGGYEWARWEHFWLMIGFVLFFAVHVIQVIKAGWNNFRSMVAGYELAPAEERTVEDR